MRSVVVVCGDAGGAAAVAPVASLLANDGLLSVCAYAGRLAVDILRQRGLAPSLLDGPSAVKREAGRLSARSVAVVMTGTSVGDLEPEKVFIRAARRAMIPTVAVLDYWSNYAARFAADDGALTFLPDRVAVMDRRAADEAVGAGIPKSRVVVTGAPQLDDLADLRTRARTVDRTAMRRALGATSRDAVVLYVPGPIAIPFIPNTEIGFTEREIAELVIHALARIAEGRGRTITFAIRPHPREAGHMPSLPSLPGVRCVEVTDRSVREWELAADVVAGTHSIALLEAAYLGRIALSVQPGLLRQDTLPTNRSGATIPIYHVEDVMSGLDRALFDQTFRRAQLARLASVRPRRGATARVARLVYRLAGTSPRS